MINDSVIEKIYSLSPMQEGMLFNTIMNKESRAYFEQLSYDFSGEIDPITYEKAFNMLIEKYDILRTIFIYEEIKKPKQVVLKERRAKIFFEDITEMDNAAKDEYIAQYKERDIQNGFDLSKDILIRAAVFKIGKGFYKIIWSFHHILMDGWCLGIIFKEFNEMYQLIGQNSIVTEEEKYPFFLFIKWLEKQDKEKAKNYWYNYLLDYDQKAVLPTISSKKKSGYAKSDFSFVIEKELLGKLDQIAKNNGVTLNTVFQCIWGVLLQKYNNTNDVVFGAVVSGRPAEIAGIQSMVGLFINTIPIRVTFKEQDRLSDLLKHVQICALESEKYSYLPLAEIQSCSKVKQDLIDHIIAFENYPIEKEISGLDSKDFKSQVSNVEMFEQTNYDFNVAVIPGEELTIKLSFNSLVYDKEVIDGVGRHFKEIVGLVVANPEISFKDIEIVSEKEKNKILFDFNDTSREYMLNTTIHSLFEECAKKVPENVALVYKDFKMSYGELNKRANQLAYLLRENSIGPDSIVGIMVEPSFEMFIGILGILKAGGAYLPIDSKYPDERIKFMLDDSKASVILTKKHYLERYDFDQMVICLDDIESYTNESNDLININNPGDIAYVIYTSGSTGRPKGVMIEHRSLVNMSLWHIEFYKVTEADKSTKYAGFGFDASVWETFPYIISGATIHIISDELQLDINRLNEYFESNNITISFLPTQICEQFIRLNNRSLRILNTAGDKLNYFEKKCYSIVNNYGPTENTVVATYFPVDADYDNIPIGKPVANVKIYILDRHNKIQPCFVAGELCISGVGVARGYINRPDPEKEKFVDDPFTKGARMYRTGDLARWLPDGNIEFLGRIDQQVKIRGYRIELGEIESILVKHELMKGAVAKVIEDTNGNKYICAYYCSDRELGEDELKRYLANRLPDYMIPLHFIRLDRIPLTPNGKIDRRALPNPQLDRSIAEDYQAPRNDTEVLLAEVWQSVLGTDRISINDSFFALGGDSIKAIQVSSRLQNRGFKMEMKDLFQYKTIGNLSGYITKRVHSESQTEVEGDTLLTPIQHWYFQNQITDRHHFNQPLLLRSNKRFDEKNLLKVFDKILAHHDALRMVYKIKGDLITQYNRKSNENCYSFQVFNFEDEMDYMSNITKEADQIQQSFDLCNGPLTKVALFKTREGDYLFIVVHHLLIDGVSWRIILEDMAMAYSQISQGQKIVLPSKTTSYKEWAERLCEYAKSKEIKREVAYWRNIESITVNKLPRDNKSFSNKVRESSTTTFSLSKDDTEKLLKQVNKAYHTEINDILLTALGMAMSDFCKSDKILINLEGHGREAIIKGVDITRTVGWFTSLYPVVLDMSNCKELPYQIKSIKESLRKIPNKGIGYGILKYLSPSDITDGLKFNLKPEIGFNYLGEFDRDLTTEFFSLSDISSGECISGNQDRNHCLDINGMVIGGRLTLIINYNMNEYREDTIKRLVNEIGRSLTQIIDHCLSLETDEFTPSDLGDKDLSINELESLKKRFGENIQAVYPLSHAQEGMLFHALMDKKSEVYFEQKTFIFEGELDVGMFERSFNILIERHDILRTNFVSENLRRPRQVVLKEKRLELNFQDISYLSEQEKQDYIEEFKIKDRKRVFDLACENLMRLAIIKTAQDNNTVIWSFHHILLDGWCQGIIIKDVLTVYKCLIEGSSIDLEQVYPYSSYIDWLENQDKEEGMAYWHKHLEGYSQQAGIPKKSIQRNLGYHQKNINFKLEHELTNSLETIAIKYEMTLSTVFQTLWGILLQKYNNTSDVVFGKVVSGRQAEVTGIEKMVGLFINTIPVRVTLGENERFASLVKKVQSDALESEKYSYLPLVEIQNDTVLKKDLIENIVVFENYPMDQELKNFGGDSDKMKLRINQVDMFERTNYDFIVLVELGQELSVKLSFNGLVYDQEIIEKLKFNFKNIVREIASNPNILISELEIITPQEIVQLNSFNNTSSEYKKDKTVTRLFEEQVEKTPNNIAVVYEDVKMTYFELNHKAEVLANVLLTHGINENDIVGIMLKRSPEFLVGVLGVLKAGGAILPIDPEYPQQRIVNIIENSRINLMVTQEELLGTVFNGDSREELLKGFVQKDIIFIEQYDGVSCEKLYQSIKCSRNPDNLLYLIYTSGSTGTPKGVKITHRNIVNLIEFEYEKTGIDFSKQVLQFTTPCFDVCYQEVFSSLLSGGQLCIVSNEGKRDPSKLFRFIEENRVEVIFLPTAFLKYLFNEKEYAKCFPGNIKHIITAGEQLIISEELKNYLKSNNVTLHNHYGPSETHVVTTYTIEPHCEIPTIPPIGKPISNNRIYILNQNKGLQPVGVIGEMYISGDNVGMGYFNQPELTCEKFLDDPFVKGEKMYRTGDMARWLPDGNIEFLGRIDHQVKIRGFRIELCEIEGNILEHDAVKEVVVIAKEDKKGGKYLCAYLSADKELTVSEIKGYLAKALPDYMIPAYFIQMESLPKTPNGKINRAALPEPEGNASTGAEFIAPKDETQVKLAELWQEVLGLEKVGINDSFFDLGGHSLNVLTLVMKVNEVFGVEYPINEVFNAPTIKQMSEYLHDESNRDNQVPMMLLGAKKEKNIFAFPPVVAYAIAYLSMGPLFEDYSFYAFDYIESENKVLEYVKLITQIQPQGPYILVGHCAGGNLGFEVAKELLRLGHEVSNLIMLDTTRKMESQTFSPEQADKLGDEMAGKLLDKIGNTSLKDDMVRNKIKKYIDYWVKLINSDIINVNIHLILAEDQKNGEKMCQDWSKATSKEFRSYQGFGIHEEMLDGSFGKDNADIIKKILADF